MIRSCRDKETQKLHNRAVSRRFQNIEKVARVKLAILDAATSLKDLSLLGLRLEKLAGDRAGQYSIRINDQFRLCFRWRDGDAWEVEIADYR
jgi:proteic killer suppression protein